jgi:hypothetical protein
MQSEANWKRWNRMSRRAGHGPIGSDAECVVDLRHRILGILSFFLCAAQMVGNGLLPIACRQCDPMKLSHGPGWHWRPGSHCDPCADSTSPIGGFQWATSTVGRRPSPSTARSNRPNAGQPCRRTHRHRRTDTQITFIPLAQPVTMSNTGSTILSPPWPPTSRPRRHAARNLPACSLSHGHSVSDILPVPHTHRFVSTNVRYTLRRPIQRRRFPPAWTRMSQNHRSLINHLRQNASSGQISPFR